MLRLAPVSKHTQATGSAEGVGSSWERQTVQKKAFSDVGASPGHGVLRAELLGMASSALLLAPQALKPKLLLLLGKL
eukprot:795774-Rhodomonas_salina.1